MKRSQEFIVGFHDRVLEEAPCVPGGSGRIEAPAEGVGAVFIEHQERVDDVSLALAHFYAVFILDQTKDHDVFISGSFVKEGRCDEEAVEPAARLIDRFAYEIAGEVLVELILVFKWIVPLGRVHRARIEPAVDDFRDALHFSAAIRTFYIYVIDVRLVQLDIVGTVIGHFLQLFDRTYTFDLFAAFAFPYGKRSSPVSVARERPVYHVFEEVLEAPVLDIFGIPVYFFVVGQYLIFESRGLYEP